MTTLAANAAYLAQFAIDFADARAWCGSLYRLADWQQNAVPALQQVGPDITAAYGGVLPPAYQPYVDGLNATASMLTNVIGSVGNFPRLVLLQAQAPAVASGAAIYQGIAQVDAWDVAAGGGIDQLHKSLTLDFVMGSIRDGYWPVLDRFNLYATANTAHALVGLKTATLQQAINSPVFTPDRQFQFDGVSASIETNYKPDGVTSNYKLNSASLGVAVTVATTINTGSEIGSYTPYTRVTIRGGGSLANASLNGTANSVGTVAGTPWIGTYHANRTANDHVDLYRNGALFVTSTQVANRMPLYNFAVGSARANGGAPGPFSQAGISAAWIGGGLTPAMILALHNNLTQYRAGLP